MEDYWWVPYGVALVVASALLGAALGILIVLAAAPCTTLG